MSSDDAIFVQKREDGKWAAQWGTLSSDELPNPEEAREELQFDTLERLVLALANDSMETEYGFRFPNLHMFGFRMGEPDLRDQGPPPHLPASR